jgi:electron transport complex protein RnfG
MTATKKDPNSLPRLIVVLFLICAVTALLLGLVNYITADRIAEIKAEKTAAALSEVLSADEYITEEYTGDNSSVTEVYSAVTGGEQVGYVVECIVSGSQGNIDMVVGVDTDGAVTGVSIVDMSETSGLGSKASGEEWRAQFIGVTEPQSVSKDGGEIDALTGATITSRAVTNGVNIALEVVGGYNS